METALTPFQVKKRARDARIVTMYNSLKGMKTAVVRLIAEDFGCAMSGVATKRSGGAAKSSVKVILRFLLLI